jgi:hypothetical protein
VSKTQTRISNFRLFINIGVSMYFYITKLNGLGSIKFWILFELVLRSWLFVLATPLYISIGSVISCDLEAEINVCFSRLLNYLSDLKT